MRWKLVQQTNCINLRGVGIERMTVIDWAFASVSLTLDREEEREMIENAIMSLGLLINPEYAREVYESSQLEKGLTEEDKETLKKITRKKTNRVEKDGKVKSDPVIQNLIRRKMRGEESIQTLSDMTEGSG